MKVAVVGKDGSVYEPIVSSSVIERRVEKKKKNDNKQLKIAVVTKGQQVEEINPKPVETTEDLKNEIDTFIKENDKVEVPIINNPIEDPINEEPPVVETQTVTVTGTADAITATVTEASSCTEVTATNVTSTPTVEIKEEPKTTSPARDANGRFVKRSNAETEAFVASIEDHGTERYPKSKKAGGAKKAGKAGKANVNSKFIPSPGTK